MLELYSRLQFNAFHCTENRVANMCQSSKIKNISLVEIVRKLVAELREKGTIVHGWNYSDNKILVRLFHYFARYACFKSLSRLKHFIKESRLLKCFEAGVLINSHRRASYVNALSISRKIMSRILARDDKSTRGGRRGRLSNYLNNNRRRIAFRKMEVAASFDRPAIVDQPRKLTTRRYGIPQMTTTTTLCHCSAVTRMRIPTAASHPPP